MNEFTDEELRSLVACIELAFYENTYDDIDITNINKIQAELVRRESPPNKPLN